MASTNNAGSRRSDFRTTFLIPNLHCPTCISRIETVLAQLNPAPTPLNISIISHSVTVQHCRDLSASTISDALTGAGYEVFDIILDGNSVESISSLHSDGYDLDGAVARWDPRRSSVDTLTREKHEQSCQYCAAHRATSSDPALHEIVVSSRSNDAELYVAVIAIEGMTCSSCTGNVRQALEQVPSVSKVEVALVNHSATVHFSSDSPEIEKSQLIGAIEDSGYGAELVELKAEQSESKPRREDSSADRWQATYSIDGMSCSSCVGKVTSAIEQLPFVEHAEVNLVQHSASVVFEGRDHAGLIQKAIDSTGYHSTEADIKALTPSRVKSTSRTISLAVKGMHCPQCPQRILGALQTLPVQISRKLSLSDPVLTLSYVPRAPSFTIRSIIQTISDVDNAFTVSTYKPPSVEERSKRMLIRERRAILARTVLSIIVAIPTFIIGVVFMDLVPQSNSAAKYLMSPLAGVSRAEWATFIMATPVYFFATDYFHRRTIKEIYSMWKPGSRVSLLRRFTRFGSMNMLISLGTTIAYCASLVELIIQATAPKGAKVSSQSAYFDSVVFLTMFLLMGRYAEASMKAKSGDAIAALGNLRPTEALLINGSGKGENTVESVHVELIDIGDVVRAPHGSSPPCDGTLLAGTAEMDESSLTGESVIVRKEAGDMLYSGTINKGSAVSIQVTGHAGASMLDSIIQVVREGQAKRAPVERIADILTAYFVPIIVSIAIVTWIVWLALGLSGTLPNNYLDSDIGGWPFWSLQFAIAVFVVACPCGLGLAAPTALFVGGGMAAKRGILVKGGGEAFQEASGLDCIVFDKTGTLTEGSEPEIVEYRVYDHANIEERQALGILKTVEENSSHPLAKAAVAFATEKTAANVHIASTNEVAGKGLYATISLSTADTTQQLEAIVGNESLMKDYEADFPSQSSELLESWKDQGYSILILAICTSSTSWKVVGIFAAADPLRPEAHEVVSSLQSRNIDVWMLSGDNLKTATAVGRKVGIPADRIIAGVLPAQKAEKVKHLQSTLLPSKQRGWANRLVKTRSRATVAMIGDGINDAPALAAADIGIAVASGSDVAVQSASFILVHSDLRAVLSLVTLSRAVFQRVLVNFFWAAVYNLIAVPIAAGVFYPICTGDGSRVRLEPAWAALAMALSSVSVVGSSLLLRTRVPWVGFRERR